MGPFTDILITERIIVQGQYSAQLFLYSHLLSIQENITIQLFVQHFPCNTTEIFNVTNLLTAQMHPQCETQCCSAWSSFSTLTRSATLYSHGALQNRWSIASHSVQLLTELTVIEGSVLIQKTYVTICN